MGKIGGERRQLRCGAGDLEFELVFLLVLCPKAKDGVVRVAMNYVITSW